MPKMLASVYGSGSLHGHCDIQIMDRHSMSAVNTQNNGLGLLYGLWWKLDKPVHDKGWHKSPITCTMALAEERLKQWKEKYQDRHYLVLPDGETPDED
jgi:hypothetical protein